MQKFKESWQIQQNWQLLFPFLGIIGIIYSSYKLAKIITKDLNIFLSISLALVISYLLVKLCLFIFKKLENKWKVDYRWDVLDSVYFYKSHLLSNTTCPFWVAFWTISIFLAI